MGTSQKFSLVFIFEKQLNYFPLEIFFPIYRGILDIS